MKAVKNEADDVLDKESGGKAHGEKYEAMIQVAGLGKQISLKAYGTSISLLHLASHAMANIAMKQCGSNKSKAMVLIQACTEVALDEFAENEKAEGQA